MPRTVIPQVPMPAPVTDAIAALGSQLRVEILRYYLATPGRKADASRALGVALRTITQNVDALTQLDVLVDTSPPAQQVAHYEVNRARLDELTQALVGYLAPGDEDRRFS